MTGRPVLDFRQDADRFDADWYRRAYPDLPPGDADAAVRHFVEFGSREGRQPNADFAPDWYLATYPRAAAAVADGRLDGPYHDYLKRLRDRLPRRPSPAAVAVGIDLAGIEPETVDLALRLAARAPGWQFWLQVPPGGLPAGAAGANVTFETGPAGLPSIDLWLDLGPPLDTDAAGLREALHPLMESLGLSPADRSPAALDRILEALRQRLTADCPLVPVSRRTNGPVHLLSDRIEGLRLVVRRVAPTPRGGGVVLRDADGITAELPPPTDRPSTSRVSVGGPGRLWLTISEGLAVELDPAEPPAPGIDLIVTGGAGLAPEAWQRTIEAVSALGSDSRVIAVAPPDDLALPLRADVRPNLAKALGDGTAPVMVVPVGARPFPQAATQALAHLQDDLKSYAVASAIRHPDGHLAPWPEDPAFDPALFSRWRRTRVAVLTPEERLRATRLLSEGRRWRAPPAGPATALAAIDVDAWPLRLSRQPSRAPGWMLLDARPDGGVLCRLRLHGSPLAAGGRILVTGRTDGLLAAPCPVVARSAGSGRRIIGSIMLPASGEFVWPIDLPTGTDDGIEITPEGPWQTAHDGPDARPLLFRLLGVRYRPPESSRPRAANRSR